MSVKKVYTCNICRDGKETPELMGVMFSVNNIFTLGMPSSTDGVHICFDCLKQLKAHLENKEFN